MSQQAKEMTTRERFHAVMNFQPFDRLPMIEWATWWDKTIDRWQGEGLACRDRYDLYRHFGLDVYYQNWVGITKKGCPKAPSHGAPIIRTMDEYEAIKPFLYPLPCVNPEQWKRWAAEQARGDAVVWITFDGFFWFTRCLLGIEPQLYAFYDQPELLHRINRDLSDWILKALDEVCSYAVPDFLTFGEDMSYNHGPMLSKPLFDEFMKPYYRKVLPAMHERGILTVIDSDGDVTEPAYWFEEAGLEGILPLERQAGVDIAKLRREHPRMRFIGHFDKMTMPHGEPAMRAEFERLLPTVAKGGFIPSVDHQTPPGVSLANYHIYLKLLREYADKAGAASRKG
ncbi:MAG: uroporphyrinogen decarboxylase family protein [Phycisphaerae bacterium]|nr:uroporphyrinogen decarboxylase family protein [Phycisphaerae bacterium]